MNNIWTYNVCILHMGLTEKFANCAPQISKIYYKIHREHQSCATEISVARHKLSRLAHGKPWLWLIVGNKGPAFIKGGRAGAFLFSLA